MKRIATILIVFLALAATVANLKADVISLEASSVLVETPFIANLDCSLGSLDLIPEPAAASSNNVPVDFNPRNIILGPGRNYLPATYSAGSGLGDRLYDLSLVSIIALNVADYFSTTEALKHPGLQEGNPLMKDIVKSPVAFAAVKIGVAAASYIGFKSLYKRNKTLGWIVSTATNFALSYVVSNNLRLIKQAQGR